MCLASSYKKLHMVDTTTHHSSSQVRLYTVTMWEYLVIVIYNRHKTKTKSLEKGDFREEFAPVSVKVDKGYVAVYKQNSVVRDT